MVEGHCYFIKFKLLIFKITRVFIVHKVLALRPGHGRIYRIDVSEHDLALRTTWIEPYKQKTLEYQVYAILITRTYSD